MNLTVPVLEEVTAFDLISDYCNQVDDSFLHCVLIIIVCFFLIYQILPLIKRYWYNPKVFSWLETVPETLILMSTFFMLGIIYVNKGFPFWVWILLIIIGVVVTICFILNFRKNFNRIDIQEVKDKVNELLNNAEVQESQSLESRAGSDQEKLSQE